MRCCLYSNHIEILIQICVYGRYTAAEDILGSELTFPDDEAPKEITEDHVSPESSPEKGKMGEGASKQQPDHPGDTARVSAGNENEKGDGDGDGVEDEDGEDIEEQVTPTHKLEFPKAPAEAPAPDHHVSEDLKDLIRRLLDKDPMKRPMCDEIIQHPYFAEYVGLMHATIDHSWPCHIKLSDVLLVPLLFAVCRMLVVHSLTVCLHSPKTPRVSDSQLQAEQYVPSFVFVVSYPLCFLVL